MNERGAALVPPSKRPVARRWPASQRLNASESCAIRCASSASVYGTLAITGAEKPRRIEGTGFAGISSKTITSSAALSDTSREAKSVPSGPTRPTANGIWKGSFSGCPGVGGQDCLTVSV